MKIKNILFRTEFLFAGLLAMSSAASVSAQAVKGLDESGYGTAGCGLGSILFGKKPGIVQIFAATTNGTSGNQTFGITTGTSNCKDPSGGTASAQAFIQTNREAFTKDAARGQGETISSLSALLGCRDPKAVGGVLQRDFGSIVPSAATSDVNVSKSTVQTLKSHPELACKKLS